MVKYKIIPENVKKIIELSEEFLLFFFSILKEDFNCLNKDYEKNDNENKLDNNNEK
jgi:hypothetical protein